MYVRPLHVVVVAEEADVLDRLVRPERLHHLKPRAYHLAHQP